MSNYLPEELLLEIFLRLPRRSLLRFRCINKSYCALIGSLNFQSMHQELNNIRNHTRIMFWEDKSKKLYTKYYKSVSSLLPLSTSSTTMCRFMNRMDYPTIFQDCEVKFLSSYYGLVWISRTTSKWGEEFYIWNPSTEVYKKIPMPRKVDSDDVYGYGFGYDYKTDDYKLVRVVIDWDSECSEVDVYTLSSNSWKNTHTTPYYLNQGGWCCSLVFNGAFHWPAHTIENNSTILVCFDIVSERFEEVPMPETPMPYPEELLEDDMFNIDVGVLGGCLCLVFHVFNVRVDVWMMQDYGVRESWTKSFSITQESITSSKYLELIWSFKNNEILFEVDWGLILYEPKNKKCRELMLDSHVSVRSTVAQNYMVSSVPF